MVIKLKVQVFEQEQDAPKGTIATQQWQQNFKQFFQPFINDIQNFAVNKGEHHLDLLKFSECNLEFVSRISALKLLKNYFQEVFS